MDYIIPQETLDSIANFLLPDIREFVNSDLGKQLIAEKRKEESENESRPPAKPKA